MLTLLFCSTDFVKLKNDCEEDSKLDDICAFCNSACCSHMQPYTLNPLML